MRMTPGERKDPYRAVAGGTTRTPRSAWSRLSGILSRYSNGPTSIGSTLRTRKYSRIAAFASSLTRHSPSTFSATRVSPRSSAAIVASTSVTAPPQGSGRLDEPVPEQPARERLRALAVGDLGPEVHAGAAPAQPVAPALEHGREQL